jgi:hypothetical protein
MWNIHILVPKILYTMKWQIHINAVALVLQEYNKSADPNGIVPFQVYTRFGLGRITILSFKENTPLVAWNTTV